MNIIKRVWQVFKSRLSSTYQGFDVRDIFFFGGLIMLGYGLWLKAPWIGYSVSGVLLMIVGYVTDKKEGA